MAPDEAACRRIVAAVEEAGVMLAVGHVMRYTPYTRAVKQIVEGGQLGENIMSVQHLEPLWIPAPGPSPRPRQLAAHRPGGLHADGKVVP